MYELVANAKTANTKITSKTAKDFDAPLKEFSEKVKDVPKVSNKNLKSADKQWKDLKVDDVTKNLDAMNTHFEKQVSADFAEAQIKKYVKQIKTKHTEKDMQTFHLHFIRMLTVGLMKL